MAGTSRTSSRFASLPARVSASSFATASLLRNVKPTRAPRAASVRHTCRPTLPEPPMTMQIGGRSIRSQPSVDHDGLARHVAVRIRDEKGGEAGDFIETAEPAKRAVLEVIGQPMIRKIAADAVLEEAGRQADH